jgi:hypothetical protein
MLYRETEHEGKSKPLAASQEVPAKPQAASIISP